MLPYMIEYTAVYKSGDAYEIKEGHYHCDTYPNRACIESYVRHLVSEPATLVAVKYLRSKNIRSNMSGFSYAVPDVIGEGIYWAHKGFRSQKVRRMLYLM